MNINIPKLSLVVLIGPSGAGKSTFARTHFKPTEIVSSDVCRGLVSDDENNQFVTPDAFELLHTIAAKRLEHGRLTVVDATNVQRESRAPLVALARRYYCLPVAIILNLPEEVCQERNRSRPDRTFGPHVIRNQRSQLRQSIRSLKQEGFRQVFELKTVEEVATAVVNRVPLWTDKSHESGPFDIIGDVHGCADELEALLVQLGYELAPLPDPEPGWTSLSYRHPQGRKAVFVGDLVDRGPRILDTLRIARNMVSSGAALCVPGNHDMKLLKKLVGKDVQITHGLAETLAELDALPEEVKPPFAKSLTQFLDGLVSHYVLADGNLVVAHAGMKREMQGRASPRVRDFALYGETTGETDEFGLPVRHNWAAEYRGTACVVYGHTPVPEAEWLNNTINVDTGCVFGGKLTALRWPERELVSVPAANLYCVPAKPFLPEDNPNNLRTAQQLHDDLLDFADVSGKRYISTRLRGNVTIREQNAIAALEVMSRFAVDQKWLIYLPPTMSPSETTTEAGLLEHPTEAFNYYLTQGAPQVICEEKHMGSRAVVVVCQTEEAAQKRFGVSSGELGVITSRTGRRFFNEAKLEAELLERLRNAITVANLWEKLNTTWMCLDCELMPWSAKAQELLKNQYAAVGAAGRAALPTVQASLEQSLKRLTGDERLQAERAFQRVSDHATGLQQFIGAYRQYCWPVNTITDLKLAPFHLLASEHHVHTDKNHLWHLETLNSIVQADPSILFSTVCKVVNLTDINSVQEATEWWKARTAQGSEGMVVKPLEFLLRGKRGLAQPAVKCRGREYLRLIYGPDYTHPDNLNRLRKRGLAAKRSLALSEFALGIEALERFVRREPLRRVHECVFGVLALESEPVDPRL